MISSLQITIPLPAWMDRCVGSIVAWQAPARMMDVGKHEEMGLTGTLPAGTN